MAEVPSYLPLDLARLVLGYLEEEECTAAYDEFIKSSPHLDEFRTNYNNAVMSNFSLKSLKDVFGEYCAYKSYIRNCKIPGLRTRLLQCKTLLDTAQLLITYIDLKKVCNGDDVINRSSSNVTLPSHQLKETQCGICKNTGMQSCDCGSHLSVPSIPLNPSTRETITLPFLPLSNLVETTQLADLPGTSDSTKRKLENPVQPVHKPVNVQSRTEANKPVLSTSFEHIDAHTQKPSTSTGTQSIHNLSVKTNDLIDCSEDIHEILNIANVNSASHTSQAISVVEKNNSNVADSNIRHSTAERSFEEFVSGVNAGDGRLPPVEAMPDSSTPESNLFQNNQSVQSKKYDTQVIKADPVLPEISDINIIPKSRSSLSIHNPGIPKRQDHRSDETDSRDIIASSKEDSTHIYSDKNVIPKRKSVRSLSTKSVCSKVTILSNDLVKSNNKDGSIIINKGGKATTLRPILGKPAGLKRVNPISTNSIIHINGVPIYPNERMMSNDKVFTPEEIMAMPTVIVLQPTTSAQTSLSTCSSNYTSTTSSVTSSCVIQTDGSFRSLEPIFIEPTVQFKAEPSLSSLPSLPIIKETVSLEKTSTPNKPLLAKKASSTPRRGSSSHVRVLDFNTPRHIIATKEESQENCIKSPAIVPNLASQPSTSVQIISQVESKSETEATKTKETLKVTESYVKKSKSDWDSDLRALLTLTCEDEPKKTKAKINKKSPKKSQKSNNCKSIENNVNRSVKKTKTRKKIKVTDFEDSKEELPTTTKVKPTINLIKDWRDPPKTQPPKPQETVGIIIPDDTPETDARVTTNNPISTKHNLSDFLMQTPYKTMVDNLQMDTPRYIDPSIFDAPMSDIKIDSIPTPNFLNTPNFFLSGGKVVPGLCATPSSYSSRPTDYSSGGSYYRPDEHEFDPLIDLKPKQQQQLSTLQASGKNEQNKTPKNKSQKDTTDSVSSRPRRQCTLKVSYCETPPVKAIKDSSKLKTSNKQSLSPSISNHSDSSDTNDSEGSVKENKINKSKDISENKEEVLRELEKKRKRIVASLKKKTPVKTKVKRNSVGSKVKIEKKVRSIKKPKTVAELRQTIGPRNMPNVSNEKTRKKSTSKDNIISVAAAPVTTKSRRKSSTPRKVDKYIVHGIDDSISVEIAHQKQDVDMTEDELPPLRVSSDDCSQDSRPRKIPIEDDTEVDDIGKIKAYIETTSNKMEPTIQELVQRGFDLETAKSIERDLLGTPVPESYEDSNGSGKVIVDLREEKIKNSEIIVTIVRSPNQNIDCNRSNDTSAVQPIELETSKATNVSKDISNANVEEKNDSAIILEDDIILVRQTFDEKNENFFTYQYEEEEEKTNAECERLDENFGFDIQCDDINIRVSLEKLEILYDVAPKILPEEESEKNVLDSSKSSLSSSSESEEEHRDLETLKAVESISDLPPLYTPMKVDSSSINVDSSKTDHNTSLQRQCLEIFDSTLNSLDTPVKSSFSKSCDTLTPHDDDDERAQESWTVSSKRKKPSSSPIKESANKKTKSDHQILMQHIDIESLLTKLHGESTENT